jgi:hypothetical protein
MTQNDFFTAMEAVYRPYGATPRLQFIMTTLERHNVHLAPWTAALILNFETACDAFGEKLAEKKLDDCMKLSKWLVDACLSLQESFIRAGTPAPTGPAELYQDMLKHGYIPPGFKCQSVGPSSSSDTPARQSDIPLTPFQGGTRTVLGDSPAHTGGDGHEAA